MIDQDTDDLFVWIVLLAAGLAGGPSILAALGLEVGVWLVDSHILVPPEQSILEVPLVDAGLDLRRLVLVILVALALLVVLVMRFMAVRARRRDAQEQ